MSGIRFKVGTRGSPLALAQTEWVIARLKESAPWADFEVVVIKTEGDLDQQTPLTEMGGRGVFVRGVERALLRGEVDYAVHSLKDLPAVMQEGLTLAAVPAREDPRDALVTPGGASLEELPAGAVVGTGSPRREAQLARYRKDLRFRGIRGNVGTRVRRVVEGEFDATVLAVAGLKRSRVKARFAPIPLETVIPAPCQGALALQCREGDERALSAAAPVDDREARFAVDVERRLLAKLGAGCHAAVGIYCRRESTASPWTVDARVLSRTGNVCIETRKSGFDAGTLVQETYADLRRAGADALV